MRSPLPWCLVLFPALAAQQPSGDRDDALHLLQGSSTVCVLDADAVERLTTWLGKVRAALPQVAAIHANPRHELGAAMLTFEASAQRTVAAAKFAVEDGKLMQQGELGVPALDELQRTLGARLHRWGLPGSDIWIARFPVNCDVPAVCARYRALLPVATADPNGYSGFGGEDDILLHVDDTRLQLTFLKGAGEAMPHRYHHVEVDTVTGSIVEVEQVGPEDRPKARVHRWNVPERFPVNAFADADELLRAAKSGDWWVARHAIEAIGFLLSAPERATYGEDEDDHERFTATRTGLLARRRDAFEALLAGLTNRDVAVRASALRLLRHHSGLEVGTDAQGVAAFRRWIDEQMRQRR